MGNDGRINDTFNVAVLAVGFGVDRKGVKGFRTSGILGERLLKSRFVIIVLTRMKADFYIRDGRRRSGGCLARGSL